MASLTKPGPSSILNADEEAKRMQCAIYMTEIGYGQTKQQLQYLVNRLLGKMGNLILFLGISLARNVGNYLNSNTQKSL